MLWKRFEIRVTQLGYFVLLGYIVNPKDMRATLMNEKILLYNKAVELLYAAVTDANLWHEFHSTLNVLFDAAASSFVVIDHENPLNNITISSLDDNLIAQYKEHYFQHDMWLKKFQESGRNSCAALRSEDLLPYKEMIRTDFHDYMVKAEMDHNIASVINSKENHTVFLTSTRGHSLGSFTNEHVGYMKLLAPHIKHALELNAIYRNANLASEIRRKTNDTDNIIIGFDIDGKMNLLPDDLTRLLDEGDLVLGDSVWFRSLNLSQCIRTHASNESERCHQDKRIAVLNEDKVVTHFASITPVRLSGPRVLNPQHKDVSFLVSIKPLRSSIAGVQNLTKLCALTNREFEFSLCLAKGYTTREASETLEISYETARKHLKNIFAKAKVSSQPELLSLINSLNI